MQSSNLTKAIKTWKKTLSCKVPLLSVVVTGLLFPDSSLFEPSLLPSLLPEFRFIDIGLGPEFFKVGSVNEDSRSPGLVE